MSDVGDDNLESAAAVVEQDAFGDGPGADVPHFGAVAFQRLHQHSA